MESPHIQTVVADHSTAREHHLGRQAVLEGTEVMVKNVIILLRACAQLNDRGMTTLTKSTTLCTMIIPVLF